MTRLMINANFLERTRAWLAVATLLVCAGCASVPPSVKDLSGVERQKGEAAAKAATALSTSTKIRIQQLEQSIDALDASMQALQAEEAKYTLVFSATRDIEARKGIDATAVAYMMGKVYLADYQGLEAAVKDQLTQSENALSELSPKIVVSWKQIAALQGQIDAYANKTAFAAVDENFVAALAGQIPGASDKLADLLEKAKEINQRLDDAASLNLDIEKLRGGTRVRATLTDIIDLLQKVSDKDKGK